MIWHKLHPRATLDNLGYIPFFLSEDDLRPASEQFRERYIGGWRPFAGFAMREDSSLHYPGDPPCLPLYETHLRDETIRVYEHAWVAIIQPNGATEIARMD